MYFEVEIFVEVERCSSVFEIHQSAVAFVLFNGIFPLSGAGFIGAEVWQGAWLRSHSQHRMSYHVVNADLPDFD